MSLDRHLNSGPTDDFRLLIFHDDAADLVAVAAHERNLFAADASGEPIAGSELKVVAITDRFRDGRAPDGRPLVAAVLDVTFDDIRARGRGDWVSMMVRPGNAEGTRVVQRLGAIPIGQSAGDDVYVLHLD